MEKDYSISREYLLQKIVSTNIQWKNGKNISAKKVSKKLKNKKTGETKTEEIYESVPSFFNFFTNLKFPNEEEIKTIDFNKEKDLGGHFDMEFELGLQFTDEIIPYALEFFLASAEDTKEYSEYFAEQSKEEKENQK